MSTALDQRANEQQETQNNMLSRESGLPKPSLCIPEQVLDPRPWPTQVEVETEPIEQRQVHDTGNKQDISEIGSTAETEELEPAEGVPEIPEQTIPQQLIRHELLFRCAH